MKLLGIKKLFVSNAAGAVNLDYKISDLMIIDDHIDLMKEHPLSGPNLDDFGPADSQICQSLMKESNDRRNGDS